MSHFEEKKMKVNVELQCLEENLDSFFLMWYYCEEILFQKPYSQNDFQLSCRNGKLEDKV